MVEPQQPLKYKTGLQNNWVEISAPHAPSSKLNCNEYTNRTVSGGK